MKFPLLVRVTLAITGLYLFIAFVLGLTVQESRFYHNWIWYGTIILATLAVLAGVYWIRETKTPINFATKSLLTTIAILAVTFMVALVLPDAYMLQISDGIATDSTGNVIPVGTITDIENYPVAIVSFMRSLPALGFSLVLTLIGVAYIMFTTRHINQS